MGKAGRPFGSKSNKTLEWERFSDWFMSTGMNRLQEEMAKLKGRDFIMTTKDLMEYFQPKLARTDLTSNGKDLIPPLPLDDVRKNPSVLQDQSTSEQDQNNPGGNLSKQDGINPALSDSTSAV